MKQEPERQNARLNEGNSIIAEYRQNPLKDWSKRPFQYTVYRYRQWPGDNYSASQPAPTEREIITEIHTEKRL